MKGTQLKKPPVLADWILRRLSYYDVRFFSTGDLLESYYRILGEQGVVKAKSWYWSQVVFSLHPYLLLSLYRGSGMFKNYLTIALRNVMKHKVFAAINIFGLSLGLASTILIYLYVADALSFDKFHNKKELIYRVTGTMYQNESDKGSSMKIMSFPIGPALKEFFSEIEYSVRFYGADFRKGTIKRGQDLFSENVHFTDPDFFEVFSFPIIEGDKNSILVNDNAVVLTESYAKKIFGADDALGQTIMVSYRDIDAELLVSGIVKDVPENSSLKFNILVNINALRKYGMSQNLENWAFFTCPTYIQIAEGKNIETVKNRMRSFQDQYLKETIEMFRKGMGAGKDFMPFLLDFQNITDMHFGSTMSGRNERQYSYILSGIALIILGIACINFMNLSIGRSAVRAIEIGVRKVVGAERRHLIYQFWTESIVLSGISLVLGLVIAGMILPTFNELAGKNLRLSAFTGLFNMSVLFILLLVVAIASGSYPALLMSRFRPIEIFKNNFQLKSKNHLTKFLVVVQFSLSVFLVISTIIMTRQIQYMNSKDIGLQKEGVLIVDLQVDRQDDSLRLLDQLREKLGNRPEIVTMSGSNFTFGKGSFKFPYRENGIQSNTYQTVVDYDYFTTMGMHFTEGRDFLRTMSTDREAAIVNEKFVHKFEIENPLEYIIENGFLSLKIVGVVKDYNIDALDEEILPVVHQLHGDRPLRYAVIRFEDASISNMVNLAESSWKELSKDKPFLYSFMDDDIQAQYNNEKRWSTIVLYASLFSVVIACMGIYGLTSITINRRIKEIGIRKVLGAKIGQVLSMITAEFVFLVIIANIFAWPVSYYVMNNFLNNYYYRIGLGIHYFLGAGAASVIIAVLAVVYIALKAAYANPVESLRYE